MERNMDARDLNELCEDWYETGRRDHDNACDGRAVNAATLENLRDSFLDDHADASADDARMAVDAWEDGWLKSHARGCCHG